MRIVSFCILYFLPSIILGQAADLFISEYIEGSAWNKAIEIYNGTGDVVDLSLYSVEKDLNGNNIFENTLHLKGYLNNDDCYVIAHSSADSLNIRLLADTLKGSLTNFNGDDQIRLLKNNMEIDRIGISGDVDFARDVTFIRKSPVNAPVAGEQDPRSNGQWDAYEKDFFLDLGRHTYTGGFGDRKPRIIDHSFSPEYPETGQDIQISVTAVDDSGQVQAALYFSINGQKNTIVMDALPNLYKATIPSDMFSDGDRLEYYFRVEDISGQADSTKPAGVFTGLSAIKTIKRTGNDGQLLYNNYRVRIQGVVTMDSDILSGVTFIQDDSSAIQLNVKDLPSALLAGQKLEITGMINQNNGMAEILLADTNRIKDLGKTVLPESLKLTLSDLYDDPEFYESRLVTLSHLMVAGADWPVQGEGDQILVTDNSDSIHMYVNQNMDISDVDIPIASVFNLTGILFQFDTMLPFNSGYKIMPRTLTDIQIISSLYENPDTQKEGFKLYPVYPNPFNQQVTIYFYLPADLADNKTELIIYNSYGQKIKTLISKSLPAGLHIMNWQLKNLASGVYFTLLKNGRYFKTAKLILIK